LAVQLPNGVGHLGFEEIDSTNTEARRRAEQALKDSAPITPLWITAKRQTAGRGRQGRVWSSGQGQNFAGTLLLDPDCAPSMAANLSFVTAVCVHEAVTTLIDDVGLQVQLKWPNDALVNGAKISGILLESASGAGGGIPWLAIGIGINLAEHPEGTPYPATSFAALGKPVPTPEQMLTALAASFDKWLTIWRTEGFGPIRSRWLEAARGLYGPIRVRLADQELHGTFEGLDPDGALVLGLEDGTKKLVTAGDVFF